MIETGRRGGCPAHGRTRGAAWCVQRGCRQATPFLTLALARMLSPPVMLLVLLVILDGVCLAVEAGLLKPSPQQLKYADQELGAL